MTGRMRRRRAAGLAVAVAVLAACASVPLKQRAVLGAQAAHVALAAAQDLERELYASKALPSLTPDKHLAIARHFERAFAADEKLAVALLAWRASDPPPEDLAALTANVQEALAVARTLLPDGSRAAELVGKIERAADEARKILEALRRIGGAQ